MLLMSVTRTIVNDMIVLFILTIITIMTSLDKSGAFTNHIKHKLIPDNQLVFF